MKDLFFALAEAEDVTDWKDPRSAPYILALCVPSSCSAADVRGALHEALFPLNVPGRVKVMVSVEPTDCQVAGGTGPKLGSADIGMIVLLAVFLLLIIVSTSYDLISHRTLPWKQNKSVAHFVLTSFSLNTNGRNLLSPSTGADTMTCLHGLRFLSILWILLAHTCYMKSVSPIVNNVAVKNFDQRLSMMVIMNATLATDTFFLLSGTLLSYIFMREWQKKPSFNVATLYIHRYLRLTPPYAFVIFFYATLLSHLGSGPLWDKWVGTNKEYCVANWWTNLLYINNYVNVSEMCMNQTWYLAVDMQLFWFSPLLLYPLAKWPRFGKGLLAFVIFASIVIPFAVTFAQRLTAVMLYTKEDSAVTAVYLLVYTRTYARAGPYVIGIALGYLLHALKGKHIKIPVVCVALGWVVSLCSCAAIVFSVVVFYDDNHEYNAFESSVYAGLHRSAWALSIAWTAFACTKGYGGPADVFLSWKLFVPLSRLTYCAYLCHYIILLFNIGSNRAPGYLSEYNVAHEFAGNLMFTLVLAAAISLAFEMPFMNLDRLLIKRRSQGATQTAKEERCIPAEGNAVRSSSFHGNKISHGNKGREASVYVLPSSETDPAQLKSHDNVAFEGTQL